MERAGLESDNRDSATAIARLERRTFFDRDEPCPRLERVTALKCDLAGDHPRGTAIARHATTQKSLGSPTGLVDHDFNNPMPTHASPLSSRLTRSPSVSLSSCAGKQSSHGALFLRVSLRLQPLPAPRQAQSFNLPSTSRWRIMSSLASVMLAPFRSSGASGARAPRPDLVRCEMRP